MIQFVKTNVIYSGFDFKNIFIDIFFDIIDV